MKIKTDYVLFFFFFFFWPNPKVCGTLFPGLGIEPAPPAMGGRFPTTGPLGRSLSSPASDAKETVLDKTGKNSSLCRADSQVG